MLGVKKYLRPVICRIVMTDETKVKMIHHEFFKSKNPDFSTRVHNSHYQLHPISLFHLLTALSVVNLNNSDIPLW